MSRALVSLVILALAAPLACYGEGASRSEQCVIAEDAIRQASEIRTLAIKKKVPCFVHNKEQVKQFLMSSISEKLPHNRLRDEALLFEALGVIPSHYDYEGGIVSLYLDQLGGYYDPDRDHFVMAGWLPAAFQSSIAVHELTHALQDQYFNLGTFMDPNALSSDQILARSGLVEGDATAVMLDYARGLGGLGPLRGEADVDAVILQNVLGGGLMKGVSNVPQSLYSSLLFPYTSGLRFVHHFLKRGGYSEVNELFKSPPGSTEEILHPEKYGATGEYESIPTEVAVARGFREAVYSDVMGEFGVSLSLMLWVSDKSAIAKAAAGWAGDRAFLISENEAVWITWWDTIQDRNEFFEMLISALHKRYEAFVPKEIPSQDLRIMGHGVTIEVSRKEREVLFHWTRSGQ